MEGYNTEQQSQLVSTLSVTLKSEPPLLVSVTLILQTMAQPTKHIITYSYNRKCMCTHILCMCTHILYLKYNWNGMQSIET